jgi:hypothetical protein
MKDSSRAVMLFNRHGPTKSITVRLSDIGLTGPVHVRDLLRHENLPLATDSVTIAGIVQHGSAMLRISNNPITSVYKSTPPAAFSGKRAVYSPVVRLVSMQGASLVTLPVGFTNLEVFTVQGKLIWKGRRSSAEKEGTVRIPASFRNPGMVVVRFAR